MPTINVLRYELQIKFWDWKENDLPQVNHIEIFDFQMAREAAEFMGELHEILEKRGRSTENWGK